ncbi:MAG: excinuclease ABC subunit UvrC [Elusimicrobiota bacterium]
MNKITDLPDKPGVYLFMDSSAEVLYVGKAKSILKRVRSHFGKEKHDTRHIAMISQVKTVDYMVTDNEKEALVLEEKLIKDIKPRYNIALKDDKSYPYIELTASEDYPSLKIVRIKSREKGSVYYGPFPNVWDVNQIMKTIDRIFKLRKCKNFSEKETACLNFQISRCLSPCTGNIAPDIYKKIVDEVKMFLDGDHEKLFTKLETRMEYFGKEQKYEKAAEIRDMMVSIAKFFPVVNIRGIDRKRLNVLSKIDPLYMLKDIIKSDKKPEIIEGYDISHTTSKEAVGSMVYFRNGEPDKSSYRKYKIKQAETFNDLDMLREVLLRRLTRVIRENKKLPDILLIDGGRGQESAARSVVKELGLNIYVLSLSKDNKNIYFKGKPLALGNDSEIYKLFKRITDEAHRFAHSYHVKRREKKSGIG